DQDGARADQSGEAATHTGDFGAIGAGSCLQARTVALGAPLISPQVSWTPPAATEAESPGWSAVAATHRPSTSEAGTCWTAPDARTTVTTAEATPAVDAHGRNEHVLQTSVRP